MRNSEWEYACRAGTTTQYSFGDEWSQLDQFAWYTNKPSGSRAWPVGLKPANAFGLHDMHGNVVEWCQDYWDEKWYEKASPDDTIGPSTGSHRLLRGGAWGLNASYYRSAFRSTRSPRERNGHYGFRVVRVW